MHEPGARRLATLARMGWVDAPSPVDDLAPLAAEAGLDALFVKRDDRLGLAAGLPGGAKVRKLDLLLAAPPWRDAARWASVGAVGSGHLVALSAAARRLDRQLRAHVFWVPPSAEALENLAYVASGPCEVRYSATRAAMALRDPRLLLAARAGDAVVVPPGGSCPWGEAGIALGALELRRQIDAGRCPAPAHVFVPVGSGGLAVGLMAGLALAGIACTLHGVAVVERYLAIERVLVARARRLLAFLDAATVAPAPFRLHHGQVGRGYGLPTAAARAACERLARAGLGLEPVYSGKAMAALLEAAPGLRGPVLFWLTPRAPGPLPADPSWRDRLPRALRERLDAPERGRPRRRLFALAGAAAAGVVATRTTGYPDPPAGLSVLGREATAVLRGALDALIEPRPSPAAVDDALRRVDRYLTTQPVAVRRQVRAALALVQQAPLALLGHWRRFSALDRARRLALVAALAAKGGAAAESARALRDLAMLGYYQRPESWGGLGYGGPWVSRARRADGYGAYQRPGAPPGFEAAP